MKKLNQNIINGALFVAVVIFCTTAAATRVVLSPEDYSYESFIVLLDSSFFE